MLPWFAPGKPVPLYLAPMAGFTDPAFRQLCKQHGADILVTEFAQSEGLVRGGESAWRILRIPAGQRPVGVQIFGAKPDFMERAARLVQERLQPDFIDLNFGCPSPAVTEQNAGSSLLRQPDLLQEIATRVARAVSPVTPVTAKIRTGWNHDTLNAPEIARRLEDSGIAAIAIHGRTRAQGYSGAADWDTIARAAAAVRVPIIGNGDIRDPAAALRCLRASGVRALMIGRAALGNPWLFAALRHALDTAADAPAADVPLPAPVQPTHAQRLRTLLRYAETLLASHDDTNASQFPADDATTTPPAPFDLSASLAPDENAPIGHLLPRLQPFTHGLPGSRPFRAQLTHCKTLAALRRLIAQTLPALPASE